MHFAHYIHQLFCTDTHTDTDIETDADTDTHTDTVTASLENHMFDNEMLFSFRRFDASYKDAFQLFALALVRTRVYSLPDCCSLPHTKFQHTLSSASEHCQHLDSMWRSSFLLGSFRWG